MWGQRNTFSIRVACIFQELLGPVILSLTKIKDNLDCKELTFIELWHFSFVTKWGNSQEKKILNRRFVGEEI